jgi:sigma-B regulation protein RsbU (phosphoserine phosphatase)
MHRILSIIRERLAIKLALLVLAITTLMMLAINIYDYRVSRRIMMDNIKETARHLTTSTINKINGILDTVEIMPKYVALRLEGNEALDEDLLEKRVRDVLTANPAVFGSAIAFEPYAFKTNLLYYCPYAYITSNGVELQHLGGENYQYFEWDWYKVARSLESAIWCEPYFDEGAGNIVMATYSVPFYRGKGKNRKCMGVVTADISLEWLRKLVDSVSILKTGYAFIISRNGVFVAHPKKEYIMTESVFSIAEETKNPALRKIGQAALSGKEEFTSTKSLLTGKDSRIYYAPLARTGWALGVIFPEDEIFADIMELRHRETIISGIGFTGLLIAVFLVSTSFISPLRILSGKASEIAKGNLDTELPAAKSPDEVGQLTLSFSRMRTSLKEYIENLQRTTAAKQKIESELNIARNIQMSFIPKTFPAFPDQKEFDLFATLEPAREVGGDLYNFCLSDGRFLHFCVGDVSDKGVPAALFMAVTQTLMKAVAERKDMTPAEVFSTVNMELCHENETLMFVTLFTATYDLKTGELAYSNAGHNPPVVVKANGSTEWVKLPPGLVLGVDETAGYQTSRLKLVPGDMIVCYTDGVTEAMNEAREVYSEAKLAKVAAECAGKNPRETVEYIMKSVKNHAGKEPQSDDITILAVKIIA